MLPSIFGENLFDDFFTDGFMPIPVWNGRSPLYGKLDWAGYYLLGGRWKRAE